MNYSPKAEFVASKRLLMCDETMTPVETIEGMFKRVAEFLSSSPEESSEFYDVMSNLDFLPNSPCLVNSGKPGAFQNLSACFVLGIEDSIDSIYTTLQETAITHKSGGGTGFNFSKIRPRESVVSTTKGVASGPVSFMRLYDASTEAIKQGGVRRGANIGVLNVNHPDIFEFIDCKSGNGELVNFNISVGITDKFMQAVFRDSDFDLVFNGEVARTVRARDLWDRIVTNAYKTGDPGLLFLDKINKHNPLSGDEYYLHASNPCQPGWTPLTAPHGKIDMKSVAIGDIIWSAEGWTKVVNKNITGVKAVYKYETTQGDFYSTSNHKVVCNGEKIQVGLATHIDSIDNTSGPQKITHKSWESTELVYNITVDNASHTYESFGFNTGNCGEIPLSNNEACCLGSVNWSNMIDDLGELDISKLKRVTTTGVKILNAIIDKSEYPTPSIKEKVLISRKIGLGVMGVADAFIKLKIVYGSEESLEMISELSTIMLDSCVLASHNYPGTFEAINHYVTPQHIIASLARLDIKSYQPSNATLMAIAPTGTISMLANCSSGIEPVFFFESTENRVGESIKYLHPLYAEFKDHYPKVPLPRYFIESHSVDIDAHIQVQATFQRFMCNAVSKTINLPRGSGTEEIDKAYQDAYMLGCKGVTVYIDGSLENQTMEGNNSYASSGRKFIEPAPRPETLNGSTHEILTGFGSLYVTINYYEDRPFEVLCNIGKSGASENAKAEAVGKLISLALRSGIAIEHIIEQISGIVGSKNQFTEYGLVTSIPDAISKILSNKVLDVPSIERNVGMQTCIDCNSTELHYEGSCLICNSCGWKSCGN